MPIDSNLHRAPGFFRNAVLAAFMFASLPASLSAAAPIVIGEGFASARPGRNLELLEDRSGELTVGQVASREFSARFTPAHEKVPNLGYTRSAHWARFTLENATGREVVVYLELAQPYVDHVSLYEPAGRGYRETATGDFLPFNSRPFRDRNFIFPLALGPGRTTFHLRCRTTSILSLNLAVWSASALSSHKERETMVLWIYVGLLLAMVLYNLFLAITARDASYWYYVAFISSVLLYTITLYGLSYRYLWPSGVTWANMASSVFFHLSAISFYQFARSFLGTRKNVPVMDKILVFFMAAHAVWLAVVFLSRPGAAEGFAVYTVAAGLPFVTLTAAVLLSRGHRAAAIYLVAWSAFIVGALIGILRAIALLPDNEFIYYAPLLGIAVQMILFSFGLADRIVSEREERIKALEALRKTEEKYRILVENSSDVIFSLDNEGYFTYVSPSIERLSTLYKVEDAVGQPFAKFIHPDDLPALLESRARTMAGDLEPLEYRLLDGNGSVVHVRSFSRPVFEGGRMTGVTGVISNMTGYRRVLSALEESEKKYRTLFENAAEALFVIQDGRVVFVNPSTMELTGYGAGEILAHPFIDFVHPEDRDATVQDYLRFMSGSDFGRWVQFRIIHRDGTTLWMERKAAAITWEGKPGVLVFMMDITERKKAEEEIKKSLNEKEILLKEVHHRVKNNMQVISSLLNLQLNNIVDEGTRNVFIESQNRIQSMALIHEKIYRSEDFMKIDFAAYMHDLVALLMRSYGVRSERVDLAVEGENVFLEVSTAIPCGLIVNELVSNSLKHAFPDGRKGAVDVILKMDERENETAYILTVRDNGVGMEETMDLERPRSLGLQLVKVLVGQLKGALRMKVDGGTEFTVTFTGAR
jgi:PAS domain S-box-containing protein